MATRVNFRQPRDYVALRPTDISVTVAQMKATLGEEFLKVGALIIGISPPAAAPCFAAIVQCDFGKNTVGDIEAVVAVLGRGEYKFGFADVAGIEVHRSLLWVVVLVSELDFQLIRIYLRSDDCLGRHQSLEGDELFL